MSSDFLLVGIDWSKTKHDVAILSADRKVLEEFKVVHTVRGFDVLRERIAKFGCDPKSVRVAIETPHGSVVAWSLLQGHSVFTLNPKQLDRFRDRFFPSGAKDDRRDARVLASALGSDPELFHSVKSRGSELVMLERMLKCHDELAEQSNVLINRARELLHEYFPEFESAVGELDSAWCWEVWKLVKTAEDRKNVKEADIMTVLKKRHVRRIAAKTLFEQLQAAAMPSLPGVEAANVVHLEMLLQQITLNQQLLRKADQSLSEHLEVFKNQKDASGVSDAELILTMPGAGAYVTAAMITEAPDELRDRDYDRLRAVAGVAPVTVASGKKRTVIMRRACRARLRTAVYHLARVAMTRDDDIRARYVELRQRGISHGAALRTIADNLLRSLVAMLKTRQAWKPKAERNAKQQTA